MADDGLVTLVIEYRGGLDPLANLLWVDDNDAEHRYGEVRRAGDVVRQTTFPGHRWLLRGAQTGMAYLQIVATDAPVQRHIVDAGSGGPAATSGSSAPASSPAGLWRCPWTCERRASEASVRVKRAQKDAATLRCCR